MKPNKQEIDALRAVLMTPLEDFISDKERESHKDPEGLAQTRMFTRALEAVEEARGSRTTYMVVLRHGTVSVHYSGFGPYSTKAQAEKATTELLAGMETTAYAVVPTRNQHHIRALWEAVDAEPESKKMWAIVKKDAEARRNGWRGKAIERDKYLGGAA